MEVPTVTLRRGDRGSDVEKLQALLVAMDFDLGSGGPRGNGVDGDYGGRTETAVREFQQFRMVRSRNGRKAGDDGVWGEISASYAEIALAEGYKRGQPWQYKGVEVYGWRHPRYGRIPETEGKTSSFGGPDDTGDRRYGQARVNADTAGELYARYPDLVEMGVFRERPDGTPYRDPLPTVTGSGGTGTAGISWLLNPNSFYCALRTTSPQPDVRKARVAFFFGGKACVTLCTDFGPSVDTGRNSDLSPGTLNALGAATDNWIENQCWAVDSQAIGRVGS
ncbi:peptidoglycan-binding domain-containing protein [Pannus brasiliensis CCIBt3594]|uniref:Peptidoglycan-binding domain-containing protein n=1 Tax=Pannus brasiliensis CCIBt3594 TaxID=1427578 RepID=A0AAW9QHZ6_9CHRO